MNTTLIIMCLAALIVVGGIVTKKSMFTLCGVIGFITAVVFMVLNG